MTSDSLEQTKKLQDEFNEKIIWTLMKINLALPEYAQKVVGDDVIDLSKLCKKIYNSSDGSKMGEEKKEDE